VSAGPRVRGPTLPANVLAAAAQSELLSRRRSCERIAEALVRWFAGGVELRRAQATAAGLGGCLV